MNSIADRAGLQYLLASDAGTLLKGLGTQIQYCALGPDGIGSQFGSGLMAHFRLLARPPFAVLLRSSILLRDASLSTSPPTLALT